MMSDGELEQLLEENQRMRTRRKWEWAVAGGMVLLGVVAWAYGREKPSKDTAMDDVVYAHPYASHPSASVARPSRPSSPPATYRQEETQTQEEADPQQETSVVEAPPTDTATAPLVQAPATAPASPAAGTSAQSNSFAGSLSFGGGGNHPNLGTYGGYRPYPYPPYRGPIYRGPVYRGGFRPAPAPYRGPVYRGPVFRGGFRSFGGRGRR